MKNKYEIQNPEIYKLNKYLHAEYVRLLVAKNLPIFDTKYEKEENNDWIKMGKDVYWWWL